MKFVDYYIKEPKEVGEGDTWEWEAQNFDGDEKISGAYEISSSHSIDNIKDIDNKYKDNICIYNPPIEKTDEKDGTQDNLVIKLEAEASKKPLGPRLWEVDEVFKDFLKHSVENYAGVRYQWMKNPELFLENQLKDFMKLCKEYWEENVRKVLIWIKNDSFWVNQIQSVSKLRKKDKEWVPYMVKMIDVLTKGSKKVWWVIEL